MADTDWGGFTDVTSLLGTDVLVAARSGAGINFPVSLLLAADQAANYALGVNTPVSNNLRYFDLYNQDSGAGSGALYRLVTRNAANSGLVAAGFIKYRSGPAVIFNDEPTTAASIAFNVSGVERLRIDSAGSRPGGDNLYSIGASSFRWSTVYAATGTINTSDAREKAWRGGLSDAEIRAGRRIIRELGWYQWLAEIERKGEEGARLHFGARAQQIIRILIEEGIESAQDIDLPADQFIPKGERPSFRSAFLCFDTWDNEWQDEYEEGPEGERVPTGAQILMRPAGNRFGLRLDQLTLFLIAVQDAAHAAIEARLAALEA